MRGPGALPVRGILYRQYPNVFKAARRLDQGGYVLLNTYETKPSRYYLSITVCIMYKDISEYICIRAYRCIFQDICKLLNVVMFIILCTSFHRDILDELYMEDSETRDENLSFLDRLKKQVPNFGN
jgi:hypothetical protein